jgi:hypothetical protein
LHEKIFFAENKTRDPSSMTLALFMSGVVCAEWYREERLFPLLLSNSNSGVFHAIPFFPAN